jgi:hypothetical protein
MAGDYTRLRFSPLNDASGILQQQGRVMLDQDWNELVEILDRRWRAETVDIIGTGVVPTETPHGFEIQVVGGNNLSIGPGRIYVDGLLAENHGTVPQFDPVLEEMPGTQPLAFAAQPYIPTTWPFGGTNPFAMPTGAGPHLVYLDAWKREATYLQEGDLIDKAVGLDTTTRLQTAWQVKVLPNIPAGSTCGSAVSAWDALTARSAGQLTTAAAGVPKSTDPCTIPPNTGYRGSENRTYRVEVHTPGGFGTAQFKWSCNNASIATQVTAINATANVLTVVRTKRDSVLRFTPGAWVEVTDDFHEFGRVPGEMHQILAVDDVKLTLTLKTPLTAAQFNLANPTSPNTRVILWDESGTVRDINNNILVDVDQNGGLIPITQNTTVVLEDGIQVTFSLDPLVTTNPQFQLGDYWIFTARVVDASVEILTQAPPRGLHHHYCRLAVVTFPSPPQDCRTFWPPSFGGECECAACVNAVDHNSGKFTIQNAIDKAKATGGKVCLGPGVYQLAQTINITGALVLELVGHGQTVLVAPQGKAGVPVPAILVDGSAYVTLTGFTLVMAPGGQVTTSNQVVIVSTPGIMVQNSGWVTVERCQFLAFGNQLPQNAAVGVGGFIMQTIVRENSFAFWSQDAQNNPIIGPGTGVGHLPTIADKPNPILLTLDLYVEDNFMQCGTSGINLDVLSYHAWQVSIANNFVGPAAVVGIAVAGLGALAPDSRIEITGNEVVVTSATTGGIFSPGVTTFGTGIICGVGAARISDNDVLALGASAGGILIDAPLLPMPLDGVQILGNRVTGVAGIGIEIRAVLASAMIKQNTIEAAGAGGIVMTGTPTTPSSAQHVSVANNQLLGLIPSTANPAVTVLQAALGIRLDFVSAAEIVDNVIRDLGMDTTGNTPRVGIAVVSCVSARIAGNQLSNIGPLNHTFSPSAAIAVTGPPFERAEVSDNVIRRSDPVVASSGDSTLWRAIYVGPLATFANSFNTKFVQLADRSVAVVGFGIFVAPPQGAQLTAIRGNVAAGSSFSALVEASVAGTCIFSDNQGTLVSGVVGAAPPPLAIISAPILAAANNLLSGGSPSLQIEAPNNQYTVLGNVTSNPILVGSTPLAGPWAPLNVHP